MTRLTTVFVALTAVGIGGWVGWSAARRRVLDRRQVLALMALELLLVVQAVASAISLAAGHDAAEPATHVVYALGSLLLLPLLVGLPVRLGFPAEPGGAGSDPEFVGGIEIRPPAAAGAGADGSADRFRAVVAALACISLVVMVERMWVTWRTGAAG